MNIDYESLKREVIEELNKNKKWVLSTSYNDYVTSRTMSIINNGLDIFFQTNECYIKHNQMQKNNRVSLCFNNISIEGNVENIGNWKMDKNKDLMEMYIKYHKGSFDAYGLLDGQVVYMMKPNKVKLWKYRNGEPYREILYVNEGRAERMDFM